MQASLRNSRDEATINYIGIQKADFMKNILVIITTSMVTYGGLTTVAMNYYRQSDQDLFHMDFASTNDIDNRLLKELEKNRSQYIKLPKRGSLSYIFTLYKLLRKYDIVHIHGNSATTTIELLSALLAKTDKRIVHIHSTRCSHLIIHKLLKPIFKKCYTDAVACSKAAGKWIFSEGDYTVLNNAIDLGEYSYDLKARNQIRSAYHLDDTCFVIGHVGKLNKQKNHMFLLDIFNEVLKVKGHAKLMLVGDGDLKEKIERKAVRLKIRENVIFCGMQSSAKKYFSAFDCFVFPSLWEGIGLALLEAQANGLNCIISDSIPLEAEISEGIHRMSLTQNANIWAKSICDNKEINRHIKSADNCRALSKYGYDIKQNKSALEDLYLS